MTFPNALALSPEAWRADRDETPCGGLTPMGVHAIDGMIDLCGPIASVYCQSTRRAVAVDSDDTTSMLFRMKSGASGYLGTMTATGPGFSFQVFGSNGSVRLEGMTHVAGASSEERRTRLFGACRFQPAKGAAQVWEAERLDVTRACARSVCRRRAGRRRVPDHARRDGARRVRDRSGREKRRFGSRGTRGLGASVSLSHTTAALQLVHCTAHQNTPRRAKIAALSPEGHAVTGDPLRVLVVDDQQDSAEMLSMLSGRPRPCDLRGRRRPVSAHPRRSLPAARRPARPRPAGHERFRARDAAAGRAGPGAPAPGGGDRSRQRCRSRGGACRRASTSISSSPWI